MCRGIHRSTAASSTLSAYSLSNSVFPEHEWAFKGDN